MATILYDHRNQPIDPALLRRHDERPSRVRSNNWDLFSRLEIEPEWVAEMLRRHERGDTRSFLLLAARMEERFPRYIAVLGQRKSEVIASPIRVTPASESDFDKQVADEVQAIVSGKGTSDAFRLWYPDMLDALGKGYSIGEMIWQFVDGKDIPMEFRTMKPDTLEFDERDGVTPMLRVASNTFEPLTAYKYITHTPNTRTGLPINQGMAKTVAYHYLMYVHAMKSYASYSEVFGRPILVGEHPAGASDQQIDQLLDAMEAIGTDAAVAIADGMKIKFERAAGAGLSGADRFWIDMVNLLGDEVAVAVVGQTMTTADGSSNAQAQVHERRLEKLTQADAFGVSASLRKCLVRSYVDINYGFEVPAPFLFLDAERGEDLKELAEGLGPLIDRGLQVEVAEVLKRAGLPTPDSLEKGLMLVPMARAGSGRADSMSELEDATARAMTADRKSERLAHAITRISAAAVDAPSLRELRRKVSGIVEELPGYSLAA